MNAVSKLNAFIAVAEKHFADVKRERNVRFPTRVEHDAMMQEAKRRAVRELKGAEA
jgi:hypothetical protein